MCLFFATSCLCMFMSSAIFTSISHVVRQLSLTFIISCLPTFMANNILQILFGLSFNINNSNCSNFDASLTHDQSLFILYFLNMLPHPLFPIPPFLIMGSTSTQTSCTRCPPSMKYPLEILLPIFLLTSSCPICYLFFFNL